MTRICTIVLLMLLSISIKAQTVSLSGEWTLKSLNGESCNNTKIHFSGTLDDAGIGEAATLEAKMDREVLRHLTRRHRFVGESVYEREIVLPKSLAHRPLRITLERVLWKSCIRIDQGAADIVEESQESLIAPHVFHLPKGLAAGRHTLTLTVDNSKQHDISLDEMAHAYTDETQIKWNGVLGTMTLEAEPLISDVQVGISNIEPDLASGKSATNNINVYVKLSERVSTFSGKKRHKLEFLVNGKRVKAIAMADGAWQLQLKESLRLWDEFSPTLHQLTVRMGKEEKTVKFGLRTISGNGGKLFVNGRKTFLRGTLECCIFPLTGTPPTDETGWKKVFMSAKEWGLNHLRFHSYCPPDAAFRVADSLGFYMQVELPVWTTHLTAKDTATCRFLKEEYERIIAAYGNHPSLCLISCGNEMQSDFEFLNKLTAYMKRHDPRRLYTTTSFTFEKGHGSRPEPEDQFFVTQWTDKGWVRGQGVFDDEVPTFNKNFNASLDEVNVPFISHEIGQYSVYPNMREIEKYTGVLTPLNLMAIREDLRSKKLLWQADEFFHASGKLATILYKEEIERALKTSKQSGYQLLGLQDFPGQSTALVGLVDAFWDNKGFVDPSEFRHFCAPVVPLLSFPKAVYTQNETFLADIQISNYSSSELKDKTIRWQILNENGSVFAEGTQKASDIAQGGLTTVGTISTPLKLGNSSQASRLSVHLNIEGTEWQNEWDIWVYPELNKSSLDTAIDAKTIITSDINEAIVALGHGKKVLLSPKVSETVGLEGKFVPVFWSPVHFPKQAGTMGVLCKKNHPALALFPNDGHSDWQWWQLVKNSKVLNIDSLSHDIRPIIQVVDNFANNRRLALAFEVQMGKGKLILTSMDLMSKQASMPEARQMAVSLLKYMQTDAFAPKVTITESQLRKFISADAGDIKTKANDIY